MRRLWRRPVCLDEVGDIRLPLSVISPNAMKLKSTHSIVPHERHTDERMVLPPIFDPFQIPIEEGVELIGAVWLIKIMPFLGVVDRQPVLCQPSDLLGRQ